MNPTIGGKRVKSAVSEDQLFVFGWWLIDFIGDNSKNLESGRVMQLLLKGE